MRSLLATYLSEQNRFRERRQGSTRRNFGIYSRDSAGSGKAENLPYCRTGILYPILRPGTVLRDTTNGQLGTGNWYFIPPDARMLEAANTAVNVGKTIGCIVVLSSPASI